MAFSDMKPKNLVPLILLFFGAYVWSLLATNERLSIMSSIMLAGCIALCGSVVLVRAYLARGIGASTLIALVNFALTTALCFYALRVLAGFLVHSWS